MTGPCIVCRSESRSAVPVAIVLRLGSPGAATEVVVELGAGICPRCIDALRRSSELGERVNDALTRCVSEVLRGDRTP